MFGAFLVWLMYKDHFNETEGEGDKLACFSTGPAIRNTVSNLISEIIGTFVLVFVIYTIVGGSNIGSVGTIPVAILVWAIGLSLGGTTGYAINPARDLGPRIVHYLLPMKNKGNSDWNYAWIPVVGPIIGAILATVIFKMFS